MKAWRERFPDRFKAEREHWLARGFEDKLLDSRAVHFTGDVTVPWLRVADARLALAALAAALYGNPSEELILVGITGTNGKTTTTSIIRHLLDDGSGSSASIGTLGVLAGSAGDVVPGGGGLTTPGPVELQRILRVIVDRGVR